MPLSAFHDVLFPLAIAFGTTGGPERRNEIVPLSNGGEQRNARRRHARRRFDAGSGVRSLDDLRLVVEFFEARRGSLTAFRFRDPFDHLSGASGSPSANDQRLGVGDGAQTVYPLVKRYGDGADAYERPITKPRGGSVLVAVDGVGTAATVDTLLGTVTLAEPPLPGAVVTAGFEFDVPVRFDTDRLDVTHDIERLGSIASVPLIEVRR